MLILGNLSGIQDFLFDVTDTGGKQAQSLRFRSFRLQLLAECVARRVLNNFSLAEDKLVVCAAGKFIIEAGDATAAVSQLQSLQREINCWLLHNTHGRLRAALTADDASGTPAERYASANRQLQHAKLRPWATRSWELATLVTSSPFELKSEISRDIEQGKTLQHATHVVLHCPDAQADESAIVGVKVTYAPKASPPAANQWSLPLDRFVRHVPRHLDGTLVEFMDLVRHARGASMLGVLKADVDSLGAAIRHRLDKSPDFQPLRDFSRKLEGFFGNALEKEMSRPSSRWNHIYTVFAGGDDLLLVGPWDIIIDFAAHIREKFSREFASDKLTLSAGCAIVKPKFPIRLGAEQAEDLLEHAKMAPKDQFAALGEVWRWHDHGKISDAGKQLADWADAGDIQRGWLHTLLELALLRRSQATPRNAGTVPEMADSRLHYHVARNWPKSNAEGEKGNARKWIDGVLQGFDTFGTTTDPVIRHLPAILRYALLATRSSHQTLEQGDQQ